MKNVMIIAVLASTAAGISSSHAQVIRQHEGVMPQTSFTVCSTAPVWALNTKAHALSRGGYGFSGVGAPGTVVTRSYNDGVFVAERHMVAPSYTYLDPIDGSGATPCSY